ncbi:MAG: OmpA family protein [Saprospirales bacterium]|nr:MAG: OmpA family protein [Saprospirales bacterium]
MIDIGKNELPFKVRDIMVYLNTIHSIRLKHLRALCGFFLCMFIIATSAYASKNVHQKSGVDSIMIENWSFMILFESNRHITDTFPDQEIEELKSILEQYPAFSIRLEARTDSVGSPQYNLALADRRLNFVRNELIKRGVGKDRFIEFVFGEDEPLADNQSPEGRQANRSVRVVAGLYAPIRMISGRFVSDEDGKGIGGILYTGSRHHSDSFKIDSSGEFSFPVPVVDNIFSMEFFSKEDRILGKTYYNLNQINPSFLTIPLKVLKAGEILTFKDVLFVGGRTTILPGYEYALNRLLNLITYTKNYRFEVQGHVNRLTRAYMDSLSNRLTNPIYDDFIENEIDSNRLEFKGYNLSEARAKTIYNFLIENGIDSNRLEWKGYGNRYLVFPNATSETQARQNRRVTIKVLGRIDD